MTNVLYYHPCGMAGLHRLPCGWLSKASRPRRAHRGPCSTFGCDLWLCFSALTPLSTSASVRAVLPQDPLGTKPAARLVACSLANRSGRMLALPLYLLSSSCEPPTVDAPARVWRPLLALVWRPGAFDDQRSTHLRCPPRHMLCNHMRTRPQSESAPKLSSRHIREHPPPRLIVGLF